MHAYTCMHHAYTYIHTNTQTYIHNGGKPGEPLPNAFLKGASSLDESRAPIMSQERNELAKNKAARKAEFV